MGWEAGSTYRSSTMVNWKVLDFVKRGGAGGTRTPDPLNAIEVLSQLSYSPTVSMSKSAAGRQSSGAGYARPAIRIGRP